MSPSGWCPECEKEGAEPQHSRSTVLCNKHWLRQRKDKNPKTSWCAECAEEGRDPYHNRTRSDGPCPMHYQRVHRRTESGQQSVKKYDQTEERKAAMMLYQKSESGRRAQARYRLKASTFQKALETAQQQKEEEV